MVNPLIPFPINGVVRDITNNLIADAVVDIYNLNNGTSLSIKTDSDGEFLIDLQNFPNFTWDKGNAILVRAYKGGIIFQYGEIRAIIEGDDLSLRDIVMSGEKPEQPKDDDEKVMNRKEHHITANAKKMILVDSEGNSVTAIPLDTRFDNNGTTKLVYIGHAQPGAKQSDPEWRIVKRTYSGNAVLTELWADKGKFTRKWTQRASLTFGG